MRGHSHNAKAVSIRTVEDVEEHVHEGEDGVPLGGEDFAQPFADTHGSGAWN